MKLPRTLQILLVTVLLTGIAFETTLAKDYYFEEKDLSGNVLVTSKYAIVGQYRQDKPTIKKLNFQTMQLQTIVYPAVPYWASYQWASFSNYLNGDIGYSFGDYLFILNNQTLELKQTLDGDIVTGMHPYYDSNTNESRIIIGRGTSHALNYNFVKNKETGLYEAKLSFASPYLGFTLSGINTAISFDSDCKINYWKNFNSIVDRKTGGEYYLKNKLYVTISYDEETIVLRNDTGFYEFYSLDEDYQLRLKSSIFASYNDHQIGTFTNDDKYLFLSMSNIRQKFNVARIDMEKLQYALVLDSDGSSDNILNFTLLASEYDRFATVAIRGKSYYLQLRKISTLEIIDEQLLSFDFNVLNYRLVGNSEWGLNFGLVVQTKPLLYDLEKDSKVILFSVKGDKLSTVNIAPIQGSYTNLQATYKYLLNYKARFPDVKFYNCADLSLAGTIPINYIYDYIVQKNVIVIAMYETYTIYDLQKSFSSQGWLYRSPESVYHFTFVFNKRGLLYEAPFDERYYGARSTVYNISVPTIQQTVTMEIPLGCRSPEYYYPPVSSDPERPCNFVFDISYDYSEQVQPKIIKYNQCTKQAESYIIANFEYPPQRWTFTVSSDKKYFSVFVKEYRAPTYMIQVRKIADLGKVYFQKIMDARKDNQYSFYFNIFNDRMLIIKNDNYLQILDMDQGRSEAARKVKSSKNLLVQETE